MKKKAILAVVLAVALGVLGGCGKAKDETTDNAAKSGADNKEEVTTIQVGTMGTYSPFSYYDENDKLTGYDIEVVRKIEEIDPSLHFEFTSGPWDTLFVGLDSDKFQMLANQIASTEERREKYYLTENGYHTAVNQLIVKKGRTDIQSFKDLAGKKVGLTVGDNHNVDVEEWNKQNGNVIELVYYEEDITTILQEIVNGKIDATLNDPAVAVSKAKIQGLEVEPVGERLSEKPVFFIFKQTDEDKKVQEKVDAALSQLIESGELSKLSIEWFGADYTPQEK